MKKILSLVGLKYRVCIYKRNIGKFLLILILLSNPILAANWKQVGTKAYVDYDSYQHMQDVLYSNRYAIWEKRLNDGSENFKNIEKLKNKKSWYNLIRWGIDCNNKTVKVLDSIYYDLSGNVLDTYSSPTYAPWSSVAPSTVGEFYYDLLCQPK